MPWRPPCSLRAFSPTLHRRFTSSAAPRPSPLRILFCGSDDFSIASLRALARVKRDDPGLVAAIDVVHRPAKRTGRGLKVLREVPIQSAAAEERCPTHTIDTFTRWTPPSQIDLIIAVSFGLFVPPRILNLARYGGLNVHPSLLPDLKGPAPIQHAILRGRSHTGVSVQTLHPSQFDGGVVLAQTPAPGIAIEDGMDVDTLTQRLGKEGASMLVDVLKTGAFMPPLKDVGWYNKSNGPIDHAGKIAKTDQHIDFSTTTLDRMFKVQRAIGDPWCTLANGERLILNEFSVVDKHALRGESTEALWVGKLGAAGAAYKEEEALLARMACGGVVKIERSSVSGRPVGGGNQRVVGMLKSQSQSTRGDR